MSTNTPDGDNVQMIVYLVAAALYGTLSIGTTILFLVRGRKDQNLAQRSLVLTGIGGFSNGLSSTLCLISAAWPNFPCYFNLWVSSTLLIPMIMAHVSRTVCLILIYHMYQAKMHQSTIKSKESRGKTGNYSNFTGRRFLMPKKQSTIENQVLISLVVVTLIFSLYAIVQHILAVTTFSNHARYLCSSRMYYLFFVFIGCYFVVFLPIALFFLWRTQDAYGIRNDLILSLVIALPCYTMSYIWYYVLHSPYPGYITSNVWLFFGFTANHLNSVIIPVWRSYREMLKHRPLDRDEFDRLLANPILFAQFCHFSVSNFTSEHTRFLGDYQLLKVMVLEAFKEEPNEDSQQQPFDERLPIIQLNSTNSDYATLYALPSVAANIVDSLPKDTQKLSAVTTISSSSSSSDFFVAEPDIEVPLLLKPAFYLFYSLFIQEDSVLQVNLTSGVKDRLRQQIETDNYMLTMFDSAKREVLESLFFNTFAKFITLRPELRAVKREQHSEQYKANHTNDILLIDMPVSHV